MTQHLSYEYAYEVAPLRLFQIRNRLEYLSEKSDQLNQYGLKALELRERAGRFWCVTRMQLDLIIPIWLRHIMQPKNTVTQYEVWRAAELDGSRVIDITVEIKGVPVEITGTAQVRPISHDGFTVVGSTYTLELDITSGIPVFHRRLERFVAGQVDHNARGELDFGHWWHVNREIPYQQGMAQSWGARLT